MLRVTVGWTISVIVAIVMLVKAAFMVASPRAWFRLPGWVRAQGTLTERKFALKRIERGDDRSCAVRKMELQGSGKSMGSSKTYRRPSDSVV